VLGDNATAGIFATFPQSYLTTLGGFTDQVHSILGYLVFNFLDFYRHGMQTRSSDENSVCPYVFPSVKRVICDKTPKTEERSVQIFIPHDTRKIV